jgi:hypothetical protein
VTLIDLCRLNQKARSGCLGNVGHVPPQPDHDEYADRDEPVQEDGEVVALRARLVVHGESSRPGVGPYRNKNKQKGRLWQPFLVLQVREAVVDVHRDFSRSAFR